MSERGKAISVLTMNTLAFTVCFACWTMNGVLVTFLVDNGLFRWSDAQVGLLIGTPILTGSLLRLPLGMLTDRFGGRLVFPLLMTAAALPAYWVGAATSYPEFLLASLGFGLAGASFAVGVAYTSLWFPRERQGVALGIFGAGNVGAALTSLMAPSLLGHLTAQGASPEGWRALPRLYAALLLVTAVVFVLGTSSRRAAAGRLTLAQRLVPLRSLRVWRFGLYYALVFGGFVALSQWMIPYYVSAYRLSVASAGLLAAAFSLPAALSRPLGGWIADRWGARRLMYQVFAGCALCFALLVFPRMVIESPGRGVMAAQAGTVRAIRPDAVVVGERSYPLSGKPVAWADEELGVLVFPRVASWQEPIVALDEQVGKRQLLARGVTSIYFQANLWIFSGLALVAGLLMGMGSGGVFRFIPDYFPREVGLVGGLVGVIGGVGGFLLPLLFGYLLQTTGLWTSCWMFLAALAAVCLLWLHRVVRKLAQLPAPATAAPGLAPSTVAECSEA